MPRNVPPLVARALGALAQQPKSVTVKRLHRKESRPNLSPPHLTRGPPPAGAPDRSLNAPRLNLPRRALALPGRTPPSAQPPCVRLQRACRRLVLCVCPMDDPPPAAQPLQQLLNSVEAREHSRVGARLRGPCIAHQAARRVASHHLLNLERLVGQE
eukprot:scaffold9442_cov117-Isochrysis_galbana.AAC.6